MSVGLDISQYLDATPEAREEWLLPIEHLSATSISMFKRCPEQFRQRYVLGRKERPGEALVIGTAVHLAAEHNFRQKIQSYEDLPLGDLVQWYDDVGFTQAIEERGEDEILWDAGQDNARLRGRAITTAYHFGDEQNPSVSARVQPLAVETRVEADFGIGVPVIGYADVETDFTIVDIKTGKAARRQIKPGWRLQAAVYGTICEKPVHFHAVSASAKDHRVTINTPLTAPDLAVWIPPEARVNVQENIRSTAWLANYLMLKLGPDAPWPTDGTAHEWACNWCGYRSGCPAWKGME